jgi:hypothetical protein
MKKSALPAALLLLGVTLSGCPIYDGDNGCYVDDDCGGGDVCNVDTGACVPHATDTGCERPSDCGTNETCSHSGICLIGDCHFSSIGCVHGYACSPDSGVWECVADGSGAGAGGTDANGTAGAAGMESSGTAGAAGMESSGTAGAGGAI